MTAPDRIDHAAEARTHIDWTHEWQAQEGSTPETGVATALLAQAEATLALVEQQRITNLIALATTTTDDRDGNGLAVDDMRTAAVDRLARYTSHDGAARGYYRLRPDIAAALGVSDE